MTHIHFFVLVLVYLGFIGVMTHDTHVILCFSVLTFAFAVSFLIHYS